MRKHIPTGAKIQHKIDLRTGKRVKIVILPNGKIFDKIQEGKAKHRRTRTGRNLARMRRRIGL